MLRIAERPQETDRDRLHALGDEVANGGFRLLLVQRNDHFAEAVHALRYAADQALRHDGNRLRSFREVHHLANIAPAVAARAAHDVDRVLVALRGDEADAGAALLDDGIGPD